MESKIFIDINYASRSPQIFIRQKDSADPRDKLVSMLIGEAMPGVRDGYCRIERYADDLDTYVAVITPVGPVHMIDHIPTIAKLAEENAAVDTSKVPERYRKVLESEISRFVGVQKPILQKSPWVNAFKQPPGYGTVPARRKLAGEYEYTQMIREHENVFIGKNEDIMYFTNNPDLAAWEWLDESDFPEKSNTNL